jgi:acetyl esterase/lipase
VEATLVYSTEPKRVNESAVFVSLSTNQLPLGIDVSNGPWASNEERLPTIAWVYGGAWIAGDKHHIGTYLRVRAARGYALVSVNYSLAPGNTNPKPLRQINTAVAYLTHNAERLHIDPSTFVLAGDSAGAQIVGQLGASSPSYAKRLESTLLSIDLARNGLVL